MDIKEVIIDKKIRKDAVKKREKNVKSFSNIDRDELKFKEKERMLLLYTTKANEGIFIRYPGKESDINREKIKPWDFRPKLQMSNGEWMGDLSFKDIWDDIYEVSSVDNKSLDVLAATFVRMAYMYDHQFTEEEYEYWDCNYNYRNEQCDDTGVQKIKWYKYKPDSDIIDYLNAKVGKIRGVSIEAYLYYNDLLAQNEDCKYYFRDIFEKGKAKWDSDIGRHNTLLTHASVISFLKGEMKFSEIMNKFTHGGVAPIAKKSIAQVTEGLVEMG